MEQEKDVIKKILVDELDICKRKIGKTKVKIKKLKIIHYSLSIGSVIAQIVMPIISVAAITNICTNIIIKGTIIKKSLKKKIVSLNESIDKLNKIKAHIEYITKNDSDITNEKLEEIILSLS